MESSKITEDESTVTPETLAASDESVSLAILFETGDEKVVETNDGNVDGSLSDLSNAVGEAGLVESSSQMEITYETASGEKAEVSGNVAVPMEVVDTGDLYSVGAAPEGDVEEVIYLDSEVVKDMPLVDMQESNGVEDIESEQIEEQIVKNIETASKTKLVKASQNKRPAPTPTYISRDDVTPVRPTYLSREDVKTRFLCPVCQKSFRQKHLLLCHIKLHDPAKPKSSSVYMSNCTTCGGNVRLTSEQARLLQERGTEDARIICSTCKILGHDGTQKHSAPIELKPAYNFNCDICSCDIKLTDDQLQLVDKKGPENIRIICAPCSVKDQELVSAEQVKPQETNVECTICHRVMTSENTTNAICAECKTTNDDEISIEENYYTYNCSMCYKEMYIAEDPRHGAEIVCAECKTKQKYLLSSSRVGAVKAVRDFSTSGTKVDGLAVMYKCNNCFCSMQVSEEQKELLRTKGVSGMKIICSACNAKEKIRPPLRKKLRTYQCDVCLNDMDINYVPSRDDDDIICQTCCKAEQRSRSKNVKNNVLKCVTCNITLSVPPAQVKKLMETQGGRLKVKCDACKDDTKVSTGESIDYRCDICNVSFGESFSKFSGHFSAYHLPVNEPDWGKYGKDENRVRCPVCDASFKSRAALLSHIKSHKPPKKKILARPCPSCSENHGKAAMFEHYKLVHNVNVESETFYFDTMEDFKLWKEDVERSTCSKFLSGGKAKIDPKRPSFMGTLKCHWCVLYKSKLMSVQKTIFCPAKMALYEDKKGGYNVEFTKTHVGHDVLSAEYSSDEIDRIVDLLKADRSIDEIINDLSKDYPQDSPEYSKIYQLQNDDQFSLSLKLGNVELIKKFRKRDFVDEEFTSGSEGEVVDLPDCLSWVDESILTPNTVTVEAVDAALVFRHTDVDVPLAARKLDVLRRLTAVLNKCSVPEHLDIIDVYLDPCEQTLIEFTSGKQVEVVEDDPPQVDAVSKEGPDVEPPEKRSKID